MSLFAGKDLPGWCFADHEPFSFDLIMADPPWHYEMYSEKGWAKAPMGHYTTIPIERIHAMPVGLLAKRDAILWLWTTFPLLEQGIATVKAWGFRYVTGGAWHKRTTTGGTAFGTGYRLRSACEPFLIGTTGQPETAKDVRNLVDGIAREHSRKPEEGFLMAERLMPGRDVRRIELFSRRAPSDKWSVWGDEVGKFEEAA